MPNTKGHPEGERGGPPAIAIIVEDDFLRDAFLLAIERCSVILIDGIDFEAKTILSSRPAPGPMAHTVILEAEKTWTDIVDTTTLIARRVKAGHGESHLALTYHPDYGGGGPFHEAQAGDRFEVTVRKIGVEKND